MIGSSSVNFQADIDAIGQIPVVDNILEVICRTTNMGFAAVARVTQDRWVACAVKDNINFGLAVGGELEIETTICYEIEASRELVVIDEVSTDERYCNHHTPKIYGFQSYISIPIFLKDGTIFGTLCAIDPEPAKLNTPEVITMFKLYADMIAFHLNTVAHLAVVETSLLEEQQTSEFRDQFIAILGHDLRNPVGAIRTSSQLLLRDKLTDRQARLAQIIQDSSFRISGLVENVLDFARGRLGDGITLNRSSDEPIEKPLLQVIKELQMIWPNRIINYNFSFDCAVNCDHKRIAQLFSNLLGNAMTYGAVDLPVNINGTAANGVFTLTVSNGGDKIPECKVGNLFQPFHRGEAGQNKEGLGLGLYIASEIAKAHSGTLTATSTDEETRFTLTFPCN